MLLRLVALNAERAAEEAGGVVRWLRPEFQDPARRSPSVPVATQDEIEVAEQPVVVPPKKGGRAVAAARRAWPNTLPEQMRAIAGALAGAGRPMSLATMESEFTGRGPWKRRIPQILDALAALGRARQVGEAWTIA